MKENFESEYTKKSKNLRNDNSASPIKSMLFFFIISILYLILNIYNIESSKSIESIVENSNNNVYILAYILVLIIGMYFINMGISEEICINQKPDNKSVFFSTFLPWIIVFGIIYFLLELFPGWVNPFSNTIGYFIVSTLGIEEVLKKC